MKNPWEEIDLEDYENHMRLDSVRQLQVMNSIMRSQFEAYPVCSAMVLGVAGGNGLEHVRREKYQTVYGVDINEDYLRKVEERYADLGDVLHCVRLDLVHEADRLPQVQLVIANLLIEYIGYEAFQEAIRNISPAYVSCVIQINTDEKNWVSDSPYIHAFDGLDAVHHQMNEEELTSAMHAIGYDLLLQESNDLPNGKALVRLDYKERENMLESPRFKAVIFDLFETLITEWGHEKYTKRKMCADLGVDKDCFDPFWNEKGEDRYLGKIDFEGSILYAGSRMGVEIDAETLALVLRKRMAAKAASFDHILPEVFDMLNALRDRGLKTAIVSNCSSEEVQVLRESELYRYFDEVILSYEVGMKKPDLPIYEEAVSRLGVKAEDCLFVGDGGSDELPGARNAGMTALQAKWYTNQFPQKRETIGDFPVAEEPLEVLKLLA